MGHRRFRPKQQQPKEHPYTRTPNPNARNYFEEMAPVNGTIEYSDEVLAAARQEREALRDAISKRMGELLLRGVTMLDAYCQICNGILMEDRNGVRTCVTCELCAEKMREGSEKIAKIELDSDLPSSSQPSNSSSSQQVVIMDCGRDWANEPPKAPVLPKKKEQTPVPPQAKAPTPAAKMPKAPHIVPRPSITYPGYLAAVSAIDSKLAWAAEELNNSTDISEIRNLLALIGEGMNLLKSL